MFASVLISYEVKSLDKTFTYKIPSNLSIKIGMKVRVPFGNKLINGFVIDILDNYDGNYEIKEIKEVVNEGFYLNKELLKLGNFIKEKTLCSLMTAYETMLPKGLKTKSIKSDYSTYDKYLILNKNKDVIKEYINNNQRYLNQVILLTDLLNNKKVLKNKYNISSINTLLKKEMIKEVLEQKYRINKESKELCALNMTEEQKKNIEEHKLASSLMCKQTDCEEHNEFQINWEFPKAYNGIKLPCKSLLDRVCFDHVNKKIILIDLKTTLNVYNFAHSVEEYDYFRQIAYYGLAIQWYMANVLNLNTEDYDFEAYIIAIGKDVNNEIRVFDMKIENVINEKLQLINNVLQKISYHISTDNWEHSPEYYEGNGVEELKCVNI